MGRRPGARRVIYAAAVLAALALPAFVPGAPARKQPAAGPFDKVIEGIIAKAPERWGIVVRRADDGQIVYQHGADRLLAPASNEKVFTTAAALDALGADWRTKTSVYATAEPDANGTLDGDLVLYGRGDPNLSGRFSQTSDALEPLRMLATQLRDHGVRRVTGALVADDSYLSGAPHGSGWSWEDIQWHFGAEVSALTFNDNLASVHIVPGAAPGDPCQVTITPDVGYPVIVNESTTTAGGPSKIAVHGSVDASRVTISGTMAPKYPGWTGEIAVVDPASYAAAAFRRALADANIEVAGPTTRIDATMERPDEWRIEHLTELASLDSLPLSEMLKVVNKHSQNLHAELVLRLLGHEKGPVDVTSDEAGLAVVREFLGRASLFAPGASIQDGCGLSRLDRCTANMLEGVVSIMAVHRDSVYFVDSLPEAGQEGTLRRRLWGLQVRAKSGSLATSKSLSGFATTAGGRKLVFSFIYNGPPGSGWALGDIDKMLMAVVASDRR